MISRSVHAQSIARVIVDFKRVLHQVFSLVSLIYNYYYETWTWWGVCSARKDGVSVGGGGEGVADQIHVIIIPSHDYY